MVEQIATSLSKADADNAAAYQKNAATYITKLNALTLDIEEQIKPYNDARFFVFHDAYKYFEDRFGIAATGSISVSPEVLPGAARIATVRENLREAGQSCIFAEPQFEPRIISVLIEGTDTKTGVIDPLGAELDDGPSLYLDLIKNMATSFSSCFATLK